MDYLDGKPGLAPPCGEDNAKAALANYTFQIWVLLDNAPGCNFRCLRCNATHPKKLGLRAPAFEDRNAPTHSGLEHSIATVNDVVAQTLAGLLDGCDDFFKKSSIC